MYWLQKLLKKECVCMWWEGVTGIKVKKGLTQPRINVKIRSTVYTALKPNPKFEKHSVSPFEYNYFLVVFFPLFHLKFLLVNKLKNSVRKILGLKWKRILFFWNICFSGIYVFLESMREYIWYMCYGQYD